MCNSLTYFIFFFHEGGVKVFTGETNNLHKQNTHLHYYSIPVIYKSYTLYLLDTLYTYLNTFKFNESILTFCLFGYQTTLR